MGSDRPDHPLPRGALSAFLACWPSLAALTLMPKGARAAKNGRLWTDSDLEAALQAVRPMSEGGQGLSLRAAAAQHGIPYNSLQHYSSGAVQLGASRGRGQL